MKFEARTQCLVRHVESLAWAIDVYTENHGWEMDNFISLRYSLVLK